MTAKQAVALGNNANKVSPPPSLTTKKGSKDAEKGTR